MEKSIRHPESLNHLFACSCFFLLSAISVVPNGPCVSSGFRRLPGPSIYVCGSTLRFLSSWLQQLSNNILDKLDGGLTVRYSSGREQILMVKLSHLSLVAQTITRW